MHGSWFSLGFLSLWYKNQLYLQSSGSRFNAHAHVNLGPGLAYTGRSRGTRIPNISIVWNHISSVPLTEPNDASFFLCSSFIGGYCQLPSAPISKKGTNYAHAISFMVINLILDFLAERGSVSRRPTKQVPRWKYVLQEIDWPIRLLSTRKWRVLFWWCALLSRWLHVQPRCNLFHWAASGYSLSWGKDLLSRQHHLLPRREGYYLLSRAQRRVLRWLYTLLRQRPDM